MHVWKWSNKDKHNFRVRGDGEKHDFRGVYMGCMVCSSIYHRKILQYSKNFAISIWGVSDEVYCMLGREDWDK